MSRSSGVAAHPQVLPRKSLSGLFAFRPTICRRDEIDPAQAPNGNWGIVSPQSRSGNEIRR